jgi:hypothetical protein
LLFGIRYPTVVYPVAADFVSKVTQSRSVKKSRCNGFALFSLPLIYEVSKSNMIMKKSRALDAAA